MPDKAKYDLANRNRVIEELFKKALKELGPYSSDVIANGNFWKSAEK